MPSRSQLNRRHAGMTAPGGSGFVSSLCEHTDEPCGEEAVAVASVDTPVEQMADTDPHITTTK